MPELPEVETTIKYLKPVMLDKIIQDVTVSNKGESHFNKQIDEIRRTLTGLRLQNLTRHGKWMLFDFGSAKAVGHLRMSGRYKVSREITDHKHNRFQFHIAPPTDLSQLEVINYIDQRRFGTFDIVEKFANHPSLLKLGPDALSSELGANYLHSKLHKTNKPIYTSLLDQSIIAGLGNIYVNETLFAVKLDPRTPSNEVSREKTEEIIHEFQRILNLALKFKGTTLIDNLYRDPEGKTGSFAKMLNVYGKKDDQDIEVIKIGGRSVFIHKSQVLQA